MGHKCILAKRSPVFAAMFQTQMKETQENEVMIEDVEHDVFVEMLRFIYSGKVHHLDRIARELLPTAESEEALRNRAVQTTVCRERTGDLGAKVFFINVTISSINRA
ncbi:hypothetical protein TSAR_013445 [Trichomalopsis sarcophagae]|uniref:BTB domain-containing protein n=1 Tax=Trichomalopsis sarcophagae TaxID=543379 RepID=A0A232F2U0_9HYME|nr:hypothetical protein TSAR_013445 [Trichomalopsis sarcophagae]